MRDFCLISKKLNVLNLHFKLCPPPLGAPKGGGAKGSKEFQKGKLQYKRMDTTFNNRQFCKMNTITH